MELRRNLNPKPFRGSHPPHDARSPQPTPIRPLLSPFGLFQAGKGGEHHHHGSLPFFVTGFGVLSHLANAGQRLMLMPKPVFSLGPRVLECHSKTHVRERGDDEISKRSSSARFCALLEEARDDE